MGGRGFPGPRGGGGKPGSEGTGGIAGVSGRTGITVGWVNDGYDCPPAGTATMRMQHCNRQGCRLETLFAGQWGTVCSRGFGKENAELLCKAMGFKEGGKAKLNFGGGQKHPPRIWLKNVKCSAKHPHGDVGDCAHTRWGATAGCTHSDDVGLCCYGDPTGTQGERQGPSDFPYCPAAANDFTRLSGCTHSTCRLEVKYDKEWGTVCSKGFDDKTAGVVCKELGYPDGVVGRGKPIGLPPKRIWLGDTSCKGDEETLETCPHKGWGRTGDCTHESDVGVCCAGKYKTPGKRPLPKDYTCAGGMHGVSSGSTRIRNCVHGRRNAAGGCRLEVKHNGVWGTVCSKGFTDVNAKVVCRSLGLQGGKMVGSFGSRFHHKGYDKIWLTSVGCNGQESWVGSCRHALWGDVGSCNHGLDVGICCGSGEIE